jgi:hypothetical protein
MNGATVVAKRFLREPLRVATRLRTLRPGVAPPGMMTSSQHIYEVRLRKDRRGVDLISDALPFGRLW